VDFAGGKVFVTGATGLLGGGLCSRLLDQGLEVAGLARSSARAAALAARGVTIISGDFSRADVDLGPACRDASGLPLRRGDGSDFVSPLAGP
jgi:uncharacterized protein YbjT (DUF2867 family)